MVDNVDVGFRMPDERTTRGGTTKQLQVLICRLPSERRMHNRSRADKGFH